MINWFREKILLETIVFSCGGLVMIFEIIGSRILAPYIGTSTYIWTGLIGVILGSLSVGYWLGGRAADRSPEIKYLAGILFAAGAFVTVMLLLQDFILSALAKISLRLEVKAIAAALLLFAPASVLFGMVTPYGLRLKISTVADAGKTAGRLYALSTIGSIAGTFAAGFLLLPFVGSVRTLYLIIGVLFTLSVMAAPFTLTRRKLYTLLLFAVAIGLNEYVGYSLRQSFGLYDIDTEYSRLRVFQTTDSATNRPTMALTLDPFSTQSAMFLDRPDELVLAYSKFYHLFRLFKPDFHRSLIIGGAGYSFPKNYLKTYPGKQIDVVEIDPGMTQIARRFFNLRDNENLRSFHSDGRVFLNQCGDKYDAIFVDAFGSVYSIPFQLTTVEAVTKMSNLLADDGVVMVNLISAGRGEASYFLQAELKTYKAVFPNVFVFQVHADKPPENSQNFILAASKSKNVSLETTEPEILELLKNRVENVDSSMPILTDDLAPVEYYNSFAQRAAGN
jgi:spermidine synthase